METTDDLKAIIRDILISQKETDLKFKETDLKFKETDLKFKETDLKFKETNVFLKNIGKQIGGLGEKFGYFTEGMALPTMEKILERDFKLNTITPRFKRKFSPTKTVEYDVFGYCNGDVNNAVIVEIKSKLEEKHIEEMIQELKEFRVLFPEFSDKHLYGILAAVDVPKKDIVDKVKSSGIYFARISDNIFTMEPNSSAIDFNSET